MFNRSHALLLPLCLLLVALGPLAGCGQHKMVDTTRRIRQEVMHDNYKGALDILRDSKKTGYDEQDRVVYWMQEGMLLLLMGDFKGAVASLQKAERRSKELYTKSISKGIKAAFVSNAVKDYPGEDYENVLVNVVKALAFLGMSDLSGALVEARKINEKLKLYNTRYEEKKNVYNQDAFAHWLMGLLFELEGSYDDARIAYMKAMEVYREDFARHYGAGVPHYLPEDAARAALLSSDRETLARLREEHNPELGFTAESLRERGEIVLFDLNGQGPVKSDFFITCLVRGPADFHCDAEPGEEQFKRVRIDIPRDATVVKIAFPQLHTHAPANPFVELEAAGVRERSSVALPISAIAHKTLRDKMHRIWRDAIIRVVTKTLTAKAAGGVTHAVTRGATKDKGAARLLGWLAEKGTSAAMQATEEADKRAWTTLPSRIDVARIMVPPGVHDIVIHLPRGGHDVIKGVKVVAGKRVFVTHRTLP